MSFIPSNATSPEDQTVSNDGFYPALGVAEMRAQTGLGTVFGVERVAAVLRATMIEVNDSLIDWRANCSGPSLADIPADTYGGVSAKVTLYKTAVYTRARATLIETTRDYDSTKSGHDRADTLEETADSWLQQSIEALSRLMDRPRTVVDLI